MIKRSESALPQRDPGPQPHAPVRLVLRRDTMQPRTSIELQGAAPLYHVDYLCSQNGQWYPLTIQGSGFIFYTSKFIEARQLAGVMASRTASRCARVVDSEDRLIYQEG